MPDVRDGDHVTGPEHYRRAERLVADADSLLVTAGRIAADGDEGARDALDFAARQTATMYAAAQVHATLALTAATVQPHADSAWQDAIR